MTKTNTQAVAASADLVDITAFDMVGACAVGHPATLRNPDGSLTGITLIVRGTFAPEVVAWNSGVAEKFLNEQRAAQRRGKAAKVKTLDEIEAQNIEGAVVRVADWQGVRQPFSADQLRAALKRNPHWTAQIVEESESLGNFGTTSESSSETT
ncbi:hypothetical protein D3C78_1280090 [compost metagenome]